MAWGTELWDQHENLSAHTSRGVDFLDRFGRFVRDRCDVESRYAADLRGLVKKYIPRKKDDDDMQFSSQTAFRLMLSEVNDLAGQHEVVAEQLSSAVCKETAAAVRELKEDRKRLLSEGERLQTQLHNQRLQLDKSKRNYDKSFKEAEKALDNYRRADLDLNLSRAEVEKQRLNADMKNRQCEDFKNEYANQLQKTNDLQSQHYSELIPAIFDELQRLDERRGRCMQANMRRLVDVHRNVFPIIHTCLDGVIKAAEDIDVQQDGQIVVERYKSGFDPPDSIPFDDLSAPDRDTDSMGGGGTPSQYSTAAVADSPRNLTTKGTLSASKFKKRGGIFGIFSGSKHSPGMSYDAFIRDDIDGLPPNQRRKRIQNRIDEITAKVNQETCTRDGLMKMKGVYEGNPALGDPMTVESQLRENTLNLEKLRAELHRFQNLLEGGSHRASLCEPDSNLSRSASDSSMNQPNAPMAKHSAPPTPQASHISSNSPESGLGTSHTSLPGSESDDGSGTGAARVSGGPTPASNGYGGLQYMDAGQPDDESTADYDELLPVLGESQALYAFDATNEGSIPMGEGEQMLVIELDQGDGWTRVRRQDSLEEGFVPTAYLQISLR